MFNEDYIKQKAKEIMEKTKQMTEEELEQNFIDNFGIEEFKREETLTIKTISIPILYNKSLRNFTVTNDLR